MKKKVLIFAVMILVAGIFVGCGEASEDEVEGADTYITVASGPTSGVYYPIGGGISSIIEQDLGYRSSVQSTGATVENINLILSDRAEVAITMSDAVLQAYEGFGAFEDEAPKEELRGLMSLYPNYVQLVTTQDSGIESFEDLEGKQVGVGAPNSGVEVNARLMFEAHGMSYDDVREDYLDYGEAIDQMRNGQIDAAFVTSGIPNSTIMDLSTTHDVKIIPIEGEGMDYLEDNYPFFTANVIPEDTYGNEEEIHTATIMNILLVNKNLSEEDVYEITKGIFENIETIHNTHSAAERHINLDSAFEGMIVPLHSGAEKYYEEIGVLE
ncbi:TAXI family TRAP transporter solute-binding subunit [Isachenkonia alkalipeptolytica]|uniref:TAXI family TRAP transporter solute-binding subunit n=1 Tax=Isachenkonia alkalipeptolytica TaxID=2565777 RepID=A0AA44BEI1_9CLOT|nr:TAXI family TRAP transporter solute-binding subunit [Isachenkonia alkalipeptolytica]NBG88170.1 TAXI family TRAP transporter solute-binding subunit [Isachenkonia alkalipeptolytica]